MRVVVILSKSNAEQQNSASTKNREGLVLIFLTLIFFLLIEIITVIIIENIDNPNFNLVTNYVTTINAINTNTPSYKSKLIKEIVNVPEISQMPELPSGCEITATVMLLQWAGVKVDKTDVACVIPKSPLPTPIGNVLHGSNPNELFIGNPFSSVGIGVYHKPIASLIDKYLEGKSEDITGKTFENILKVIDDGRPVIMWATLELKDPSLSTIWYDGQGNRINWMAPEHAYLLIGYSDTEVIVHDPYTGKRQYYPIDKFEKCWYIMGSQAVTVNSNIKGNVILTDIGGLKNVPSP